MDLQEKQEKLQARLEKLEAMEAEIRAREKAVKTAQNEKKQLVLRLSKPLWDDIAQWAEADFRSINGQIEFLLADAVRRHKSGK